MVAVISSAGLGVYTANGSARTTGAVAGGQDPDQIAVNASTGNLVVQQLDEQLAAAGVNLSLVRTYNSQGLLDGDNNDNWRIGVYERIYNLTGTLNTAGSTITKTFGDGADVVYTYDTTQQKYVSTTGGGTHDTLSYSTSTQQWTWTDGSARTTETYDWLSGAGKLLTTKDTDGKALIYTYTGTLLTSITDASGQQTFLDYTGNNLQQIRVVSGGVTQTLTRYHYDASNRLSTVTVDLSPQDNSVTDGKTFVTTYTYDGASTRVTSISQSDGSAVGFTYALQDGQYRLKTYVVTSAASVTRTTTFNYSNYNTATGVYLQTDVTDALGLVTTYKQDVNGRLTAVLTPPVNGNRLETDYGYDASGNITSITEDPTGLNRVTTYSYDANGNITLTRDALGNTITCTYDAANQLLTKTTYLVNDPDGAGAGLPSSPLTTRYVYDAEEHLRFVVDADGRVTEYRYNPAGQCVLTLKYTGAAYNVGALPASTPTSATSLTEAQLQTWAASQNLTQLERTDFAYDFRAQLTSTTTWTATSSTGAGTGTASITRFIYDQRGNLLQTIDSRGTSTPDATNSNLPYATTYTYDGLGRVLTTTQWIATNGTTQITRTTTNQYDAANNRIVSTFANGLVSTSTYDKAGELTSFVDTGPGAVVLGTTTYKYDADGRLLMTTDPTGVSQYIVYDAAGRSTGKIDGNGALTEFVYDGADEIVKTIAYATLLANTSALVTSGGTPLNPAIEVIRPPANVNDQIARNVYNAAGQLVYTIDEAGDVTQTVYDGAGRITDTVQYATSVMIPSSVTELRTTATANQLTDPSTGAIYKITTDSVNDRRTRYFYDNDGNLVGTLDAAGYLIENVYESAGELIQTIGYANLTNSTLWLTGTLAQLRPALDNSTADDPEEDANTYYFYDGEGRQIGQLDGEGYLTETQYDTAGHITQTLRYDRQLTYTAGSSTFQTLKTAASSSPAPVIHTQSYVYDGAGRVIQETNFEGTITAYTYDSTDNLISSTVALGTTDARTTQARYDALGRVTQELSAEGSTKITSGMTQAQIDAVWGAYSVTYAYDMAGRRINKTEQTGNATYYVGGKKTSYYYDQDGNVRFTVDTSGEVTEYRYNALNQITDTIRYTNRISNPFIDGNGNVTYPGGLLTAALISQLTPAADTVHDAHTSYTYALTGQVASQTTILNATDSAGSTYVYNAFGEEKTLTQKIDATHTRTSSFLYDVRGLLKSAASDTTGLNLTTSQTYDAFGRVRTMTDARGNASSFEYDRLGRTVATVDTLGGRRVTTYDAFDRVLTTRDALYSATNNSTTAYAYNDATRSVTVTTPEGIQLTTVHNREGQTLTVTAAGNTTTYGYDANGQINTISDGLGILETRTYDTGGKLITDTDALGAVTTLSYDAANRVLQRSVTSPSGGSLSVDQYKYDGQGRVIQTLNANGIATRMDYDNDGRVTQVTVDPTVAYVGAVGSSSTYTNPNALNIATAYTYDQEGRTLTVTEGAGSASARTTQYVYDTMGRMTQQIVDPGTDSHQNLTTQYKYDNSGNVTRVIDPNGNSTWYVYDAGNRLRYTVDGLGEVTETVFDAENRLIGTHEYQNAVATSGFGDTVSTGAVFSLLMISPQDSLAQTVYDKDGRAVYSIDAVGGVTERTFDANGNVTRSRSYASRIAAGSYTTAAQVQSALTAAGNSLTTVSASDAVTWSAYDLRGELAFTVNGVGAVTQYVYDNAGNITKTIQYATLRATTSAATLASLASWAATTSIANNVQNVTTQYAYDAMGRLVMTTDATGVRTFLLYDALGRKIAAVDGNGTLTTYVYNAADQVVQSTRYADALPASSLTAGGSYSLLDSYGNPTNLPLSMVLQGLPPIVGRASDQITRYVYDTTGQICYLIDPAGDVTQTFYDTAGRVNDVIRYATPISIPNTVGELRVDPGTTLPIDPATNTIYGIPHDDANDRHTRYFPDNDGNVIGVIDAAGYLTKYAYDVAGRRVSSVTYANVTDPSKRWTASLYDVYPGADNSTTDDPEEDSWTDIYYDGEGRVIGVLDGEGYLTETQYDAAGHISSTTRYDFQLSFSSSATLASYESQIPSTAARHTTTYQYDGVGRLQQQTNYEGTVTTYGYDNASNLVSVTQAFNTSDARTAQTRYDAFGRVIQELTAQGSVALAQLLAATPGATQTQINAVWTQYGVKFAYDAAGRKISATDENNLKTLYYYDSDGNVRFTVDAAGEVQEYRYNGLGQLTDTLAYTSRIALTGLTGGLLTTTLATQLTPAADAIHDARTSYTYTLTGAVSSQVTVLNGTDNANSVYAYDAFGDETTLTQKIDAARTRTDKYVYDVRGLLKSATADTTGLNLTTSETYDAFGRQATATDALGNTTRTMYDRLGRVIDTVDAVNVLRSITYDAFGRVLTTRDGMSNTTHYVYNDAALSVTVTTPEGISVTTAHNREGQTLSVAAAGNTTTYSYDANGYVNGVSDNLGAFESRTFDAAGRELADTNALGMVTKFTYDAANRVLTRTVDPKTIVTANDNPNGLNLVTTYVYDGQGRVTQVTEPSGRITATSYDNDGRVTDVAIDPAGLNLRTHYTYDLESRQLTVTQGYGTTNAETTQYVYDTLGRRTQQIVDPGTGHLNLTTQYEYDNDGNMTRSIDARGNSTWYAYDNANRLIDTIDALGDVTALSYDGENRVIGTRAYSTPVSTAAFGDVVTAVNVTAVSSDRFEQTVYDGDGRAIYSINAVGTVTERTFDANGSVTRVRIYGTAVPVALYLTKAAVQSALTAAGNSTTTVSSNDHVTYAAYDLRNRVAFTIDGANSVVQYRYDAAGEVVSKTAYATAYSGSAVDLLSLNTWASGAASATVDETTQYWYDAAGRNRFVLDAEGYLHETRYDDANRKITKVLYSALPTVAATASTADLSQSIAAGTAVNGSSVASSATTDQISVTVSDKAGRVTQITGGEGYLTKYIYDSFGNVLQVWQALNVAATKWEVTYRYYDAANRQSFSLTGEKYLTAYSYDAAGNITARTVYDTRVALPAAGALPVPVVGDTSHSTLYTYDNDNRLQNQMQVLGTYTTTLTSYTVPAGGADWTSIAIAIYGTAAVSDELAAIMGIATLTVGMTLSRFPASLDDRINTAYSYDAYGNCVAVYQAAGSPDQRGTTYKYDAADRLIETTQAAGTADAVTTHFDLDVFGNVQVRHEAYGTASERVSHFYYDGDNRAYEEINALSVIDYTGYDAFGNVRTSAAAFVSADMRIETYTYDRRNLQTSVTDAANEVTTFGYDAAGNRIAETNANYAPLTTANDAPTSDGTGVVKDYYRNWRMRMGIVYTSGSLAGQGKFAADLTAADKQLIAARTTISYGYDRDNRLVQATDAMGVVTQYVLDGAGNKVQTTQAVGLKNRPGLPDEERVTLYTYDNDNRVLTVTDPLLFVTKYTYDVLGNQLTITDANGGVRTNKFDRVGQLTTSTLTVAGVKGGGILTANTYDRRGNLLTATQSFGDGSDARTTSYAYDFMNRQTVVTDGEGFSTKIVYDLFGNQTSVTHGLYLLKSGQAGYDASKAARATNPLTTTFGYDAANRLTDTADGAGDKTHYGYDSVGNRTSETQAYGAVDAGGNSAAETTTYRYDAANRMIQMDTPVGGETRYSYDEQGNKIAESVLQSGMADGSAFYQVKSGDTWSSIAQQLYGNSDPQIVLALAYMGGTSAPTPGAQLKNLPASLPVSTTTTTNVTNTVAPYYVVQAADIGSSDAQTWTNIAQKLYGTTYTRVTTALTQQYGSAAPTAGTKLSNLPVGPNSSTALVFTSTSTSGPYYVVTSSTSWASITADLYGSTAAQYKDAIDQVMKMFNNDLTPRKVSQTKLDLSITYDTGIQGALQQSGGDSVTANLVTGKLQTDPPVTTTYTLRNDSTTTTTTTTSTKITYYSLIGGAATPSIWATQTYEYDSNRNLTAEIDPYGTRTEHYYDEMGNVVENRYAAGTADQRSVRMEYDLDNRMTADIDGIGCALLTSNDAGFVQMRKDAGVIYTSGANIGKGKLVSDLTAADQTTLKALHSTTYAYDNLGNRTKVTDALGNVARYYYDKANQLTSILDPNGYVTAYQYDSAGNRTQQRIYLTRFAGAVSDTTAPAATATDRIVTMAYDKANQLISRTDPDGATNTGGTIANYVYDSAGKKTAETLYANTAAPRVRIYKYDAAGRLWVFTDVDQTTTTYTYDAASNIKTEAIANATDPGSARTLQYGYDLNNRQTSAQLVGADGQYVSYQTTDYDLAGNVIRSGLLVPTSQGYGYPYKIYGYDLNNHVVSETDGSGNAMAYGYDKAGNRTSMTDRNNNTTTYVFDQDNRQTTVIQPAVDVYGYSAASGTWADSTQTPTTTTVYDAVGNAVQIVDANGGKTTRYHDADGRLVAELNGDNDLHEYTYDAMGDKLTETDYTMPLTDAAHMPNVVATDNNRPAPPATGDVRVTKYQYDMAGRLTLTTLPPVDVTNLSVSAAGALNTTHTVTVSSSSTTGATNLTVKVVLTAAENSAMSTTAGTGGLHLAYRVSGTTVYTDLAMTLVSGTTYSTTVSALPAGAYDLKVYYLDKTFGQSIVVDSRPIMTSMPTATYTSSTTNTEQALTERTVYNAYGDAVETDDRAGNRTLNYYDSNHRKVASVDALGYLTEWDYDSRGNILEQRVYTTPLANPASLTSATRPPPPAPANGSSYGDGELYRTDWQYDAASRIVLKTDPSIAVFDPQTQVASEVRPQTSYVYDTAGNLRVKTTGAGTAQASSEYWLYDGNNRCIGYIDASRVFTYYIYDRNGNGYGSVRYSRALASSLTLDPTAGVYDMSAVSQALTAYDLSTTEISTSVYDALNRVVSQTDWMNYNDTSDDLTASYRYDAVGNRTALTDSVGNSLATSSAPYYAQWRQDLGYAADVTKLSAADQVALRALRTSENAYDAEGRVIRTVAPDGTGALFQYDGVGNLTSAYSGSSTNTALPADAVTATLGTLEDSSAVTVGWHVGSANTRSWVVYGTVPIPAGLSYGDQTNTFVTGTYNLTGSLSAALDSVELTKGTTVYYRVITQDSGGNISWTAQQSLTAPRRISALSITQSSSQPGSLIVSATFDSALASNGVPTLYYGAGDAVSGGGGTALTFVRVGTTSTYTAILANYNAATMAAYSIHWQDAGVTYTTAVGSFSVPGDRVGVAETIALNASGSGSNVTYTAQLQASVPTAYAQGFTVVRAQWCLSGSSAGFIDGTSVSGVDAGNGTTSYSLSLGATTPLSAGTYTIALTGVRADGTQVALDTFDYVVGSSYVPSRQAFSWIAPSGLGGDFDAVALVNGQRATVTWTNGRITVDSPVLITPNSSVDYQLYYGYRNTTGSNTLNVTSAAVSGSTTSYNVGIGATLTASEVANINTATSVGPTGLHLAWRAATSGTAFPPGNDVVLTGTASGGNYTYSKSLAALAAGSYDIELYYYDKQGHMVIVQWQRVGTSTATSSFTDTSKTIMASEAGTLANNSISHGGTVLAVTPGLFTGAIDPARSNAGLALTPTASGSSGASSGNSAGYLMQYSYNALNEKISSIEKDGLYREFGVDANGNDVETRLYGQQGDKPIVSYTAVDARGRTTAQYDAKVIDPNAAVSSYTVLAGDTLASLAYEFYGDASLAFVIGDKNNLASTATLTAGAKLSLPAFARPITRYTYDALNRMTGTTNASGYQWKYTYNALGTQVQVQDPNLNNSYSYIDQFGNVTKTVANNNATTRKFYDLQGHLIKEIDPMGNVTQYTYDVFGRQITQTDGRGYLLVTSDTAEYVQMRKDLGIVYKSGDPGQTSGNLGAGKLAANLTAADKAFLANAFTTRYTYDNRNRLASVEQAEGWHMAYDNAAIYQDARSNISGYSSNAAAMTDAQRSQVRGDYTTYYAYDGLNDRIETSVFQRATVQRYDTFGRLTDTQTGQSELGALTAPDSHRDYDVFGNLIDESDAMGRVTYHSYDNYGRVTLDSYFDDDGTWHGLQYQYDDLGRVTREYSYEGGEIAKDVRTTYDDAGRTLKIEDYSQNPSTGVSGVLGVNTTYSYTLTGLRNSEVIVTPADISNDRNISYVYDKLGQLTASTDTSVAASSGGRPLVVTTGYDSAGNRTQSYTNLLWDWTGANTTNNPNYRYINHYYQFDADGHVLREYNELVSATGAITDVNMDAYTYDAAGNIKTWSDYSRGIKDAQGNLVPDVWTYATDANNRVAQATATIDGVFTKKVWTYDFHGNVTDLQTFKQTGYTHSFTAAPTTSGSTTSLDVTVGLSAAEVATIGSGGLHMAWYSSAGKGNEIGSINDALFKSVPIGDVAVAAGSGAAANSYRTTLASLTPNAYYDVKVYYFDTQGREVIVDWQRVQSGGTLAPVSNSSFVLDSSTSSEFDMLLDKQTQTQSKNSSQPSQETNTWYDATGRVTSMSLAQSGNTFFYNYYYYGDGRQREIQGSGPATGTTYFSYDFNNNRTAVSLGQGDGMTRPEYETFVYDNEGHILYKWHDDGKTSTPETREYLYADDNPIGEKGFTAGKPVAIFDDQTYSLDQPIGASNPGTNSSYTVRAGDSLQAIASTVYGNPSLWFVIADANGLDASQALTEGTTLIIPNTIQSGTITAANHALYNDGAIVGSTLPNLTSPPPPPPQSQSGCAKLVAIVIVVVVAIAVSVVTAGAAAAIGAAIVGALGTSSIAAVAGGVALTVAATAAVGGLAAIAGDTLKQGVFNLAGWQSDFNTSELEQAGVAGTFAGAASGLGGYVSGAAELGTLSDAEATVAKASMVGLKAASVATPQLFGNNHNGITNITGILAVGASGWLEGEGDIANGAANGVGASASTVQNTANTIHGVNTAITAVNVVTPWVQLGETYVRNQNGGTDNNGRPIDFSMADWTDAVASSAGAGLAAGFIPGQNKLSDAFEKSATRAGVDLLVSGALLGMGSGAQGSYLDSAIGKEVGNFIGGYAASGIDSAFFSQHPKDYNRVYDDQRGVFIDSRTNQPVDLQSDNTDDQSSLLAEAKARVDAAQGPDQRTAMTAEQSNAWQKAYDAGLLADDFVRSDFSPVDPGAAPVVFGDDPLHAMPPASMFGAASTSGYGNEDFAFDSDNADLAVSRSAAQETTLGDTASAILTAYAQGSSDLTNDVVNAVESLNNDVGQGLVNAGAEALNFASDLLTQPANLLLGSGWGGVPARSNLGRSIQAHPVLTPALMAGSAMAPEVGLGMAAAQAATVVATGDRHQIGQMIGGGIAMAAIGAGAAQVFRSSQAPIMGSPESQSSELSGNFTDGVPDKTPIDNLIPERVNELENKYESWQPGHEIGGEIQNPNVDWGSNALETLPPASSAPASVLQQLPQPAWRGQESSDFAIYEGAGPDAQPRWFRDDSGRFRLDPSHDDPRSGRLGTYFNFTDGADGMHRAILEDGTSPYGTISAGDPANATTGRTGRSLLYSFFKRAQHEGLQIKKFDFYFPQPDAEGLWQESTNWQAAANHMTNRTGRFEITGVQSATAQDIAAAVANTPSGRALVELGMEVGRAEINQAGDIVGHFVPRAGARPTFREMPLMTTPRGQWIVDFSKDAVSRTADPEQWGYGREHTLGNFDDYTAYLKAVAAGTHEGPEVVPHYIHVFDNGHDPVQIEYAAQDQAKRLQGWTGNAMIHNVMKAMAADRVLQGRPPLPANIEIDFPAVALSGGIRGPNYDVIARGTSEGLPPEVAIEGTPAGKALMTDYGYRVATDLGNNPRLTITQARIRGLWELDPSSPLASESYSPQVSANYETRGMIADYLDPNFDESTMQIPGVGGPVQYLDEAGRAQYELFAREGKLYDASGNLFDTTVGVDGRGKTNMNAIAVMDSSGRIFASNTPQIYEFQHSSFLAGGPVAWAGQIGAQEGVLTFLSNRSGHYRLPPSFMQNVFDALQNRGVQLPPVNNIRLYGSE